MGSQQLNLKIKGLHTDPNNFSEAPNGSLSIADNIVIDKDSVAESRRGQAVYSSALSGTPSKLFNYRNAILTHYGTKLAYDSNDAGTFVEYSGSYSVPDSDYRMQAIESNRNFYFTTSQGIYKLDALTATPVSAGAPKGLDGTATANIAAGGWLVANAQSAYRVVWGYRDRNNNLILGAPSQRITLIGDPANPTNATLTFTIPQDVTTSYIYQVYRAPASASTSTPATDEMRLVYEANPTSAQIVAKSVTISDVLPVSLEGAYLYTSPSQEGIVNANEVPPFSKDLVTYKNYTFYANTRTKQRFTFTLIGVDDDSTALGYYIDGTVGTTSGSPNLTTIASTTNIRVGMRVVGAGIPSTARVQTITGANTLTMTVNATATASVSVEFQDRLTIGQQDFWAGSAENIGTNTFLATVSGTPGTNIAATATSIVRVINQSSSNTQFYAYYLSGYLDLPGQILIEERALGGSVYELTSTAGSSFNPTLPERQTITSNTLANPTVVTSTSHGLSTGDSIEIYGSNSTPSLNGTHTVTVLTANTFTVPVNVTAAGTTGFFNKSTVYVKSDNEERPNRVMFSKLQQPEACPLYATIDVGSRNDPIKRIVALRDSIFIFKDDGIFRVTGEDPNSFRVSLFDSTAKLLAPESAAVFNNQVFIFSDQGVAAVSDNGVQIVSRPIESTLLQLSSSEYPNFQTATFATAYESNRQYILFTISETTDTYATQAFIYNSFTNAWTRWDLSRSAGIINSRDNKLYMANPVSNTIYKERKEFTEDDYADEEFAVTINSLTSTSITLASVTGLSVGMTIQQGVNRQIITAINSLTLTVESTSGFTTGAATVYKPIAVSIAFLPFDTQNPGITKQFREMTFTFRSAAFEQADLEYTTNFTPYPVSGELRSTWVGPWGGFPWGSLPWGGSLGGQQAIRTLVPLECQRAHWMTVQISIEQAFTSFSFTGLSLVYNKVSERFR